MTRGVAILVGRDGLITEPRLYMEPVELGGEDIEAAVRELYKSRRRSRADEVFLDRVPPRQLATGR